MLQAGLLALERRCIDEAPHLLADVRRLLALSLADDSRRTLPSLVSDMLLDPSSRTPTQVSFGPDESTEEVPSIPTQGGPRYHDLGPIATGGMGEVRRVRDRMLNRVLAMKLVRPAMQQIPSAVSRFVGEAQTTAQLQHPHIVPVYDIGVLDDGRAYFTMKEVRGRTLSTSIDEVFAAPLAERPVGLRRLVEMLYRASQAVGFAHERGVVHRDLKPDNIMVGAHGEVLVMDWGLSRVRGAPTEPDRVVTDRSSSGELATRQGAVAGTPAYMAPEQARGQLGLLDATTDVYALGAVLYEMLSGRTPYQGVAPREIVKHVRRRGPAPLADIAPQAPEELVAICDRAMARSQADRHPSAEGFADDLQAWLDGTQRRAQGLAFVARADELAAEAEALQAGAQTLRATAEELLSAVPRTAPEEDKAQGWQAEEEADAVERQAELRVLERRHLLHTALSRAPDLAEAHASLASDLLREHEEAEDAKDLGEASKAAFLLRRHVEALPASHAVRRACDSYLAGEGALTVVTDPPGAEVWLTPYVRSHKRLVEGTPQRLGVTPLHEHTLPIGSYLCHLRHPGRADVRYPVHLRRRAHWHGVRPGDNAPHPVYLPRHDELGPEDCYVPAGWFIAGDTKGYAALPPNTRLWCDGFVLRRFSLTNREVLAFLDDLVAQGREDEALHHAPRERGSLGELGPLVYGRDDDGRFILVADTDGDTWTPELPVLMMDWHGARAYAAWLAERTGQPWRLPAELEWEKAARGVDGRAYPWGDGLDPSFACYRDAHEGRPLPHDVDSFPLDVSPYGVRGMGGNARDWCEDLWTRDDAVPGDLIVRPHGADVPVEEDQQRAHRGGYWFAGGGSVLAAFRYTNSSLNRYPYIGIRMARTLGSTEP